MKNGIVVTLLHLLPEALVICLNWLAEVYLPICKWNESVLQNWESCLLPNWSSFRSLKQFLVQQNWHVSLRTDSNSQVSLKITSTTDLSFWREREEAWVGFVSRAYSNSLSMGFSTTFEFVSCIFPFSKFSIVYLIFRFLVLRCFACCTEFYLQGTRLISS